MKKYALILLVLGCVYAPVSTVMAAGLGISFPSAFGTTKYDNYDADASQFGINFIFDTNVARNSLFNYRLNFGVEFFNHDFSFEYEYFNYDYYITDYATYSGTHEGIRIVADNTFGFGIVKSPVIRLWMGPNIRFGFIAGDETGITVGAGATILGLNFNMGRVFTLALEAGYLFDADIYFDSRYVEFYSYEAGTWVEDYSDTGINNLFTIKLSILFRIRDNYENDF
ncbi:MAG: hypothetical protein P8X42_11945 [Calditrichaceae bacterium]